MVTLYCLNVGSRHITLYPHRALLLAQNHHERNKVMKRTKHTKVCLFVVMISAGGTALATCPDTMPVALLVDCIVYEGDEESSFPTGDYTYMDHYQAWLKTQPPTAIFPSDAAGSPITE